MTRASGPRYLLRKEDFGCFGAAAIWLSQVTATDKVAVPGKPGAQLSITPHSSVGDRGDKQCKPLGARLIRRQACSLRKQCRCPPLRRHHLTLAGRQRDGKIVQPLGARFTRWQACVLGKSCSPFGARFTRWQACGSGKSVQMNSFCAPVFTTEPHNVCYCLS
jgi:hypothetical protein